MPADGLDCEMITDLITVTAALLVLVFLSTVESAYESLSEVSLRLMETENLSTSRGRFFHELMDHRLRFELALILGTQLSIVVIAIYLLDLNIELQIPHPLVSTSIATTSEPGTRRAAAMASIPVPVPTSNNLAPFQFRSIASRQSLVVS